MNRNFPPHIVGAFALAILGLCLGGLALGQTQAWDTNVSTWTAPTACTTGEPVSACAVTGYRLERSATQTGTFATVASVAAGVLTYTHTGVTAGQNCYRVFALSANGESPPSNVGCKTNTRPVGPPNAPVLTVTGGTAYDVRPNYTRWVFERGTVAGKATIGAACDEDRCVAGGYCVVSSRRALTPRPPDGEYRLAKCSAGG